MDVESSRSAGRHVSLYGVQVTSEPLYQQYREGMTPILQRHGGSFGYDFVISQVLKSEVDAPINRVFTMVFPDQSAHERFFSDPDYLTVRSACFVHAVSTVTKIASYEDR